MTPARQPPARAKVRCLATVAIPIILASSTPCTAQEPSPTTSHPFTLGTWGGDSPVPGTEVYDVRIPMSFKVFQSDRDDWGLRIRLVLYGGIYDFTIEEAIDLDLTFQSLAATPGVEFLVPVGKGWILKPFAEIGYGHDFDNAFGFGVWSVGMRTIVTWPVKKWHLSFGTKVQYLSTFTSNIAVEDDYGEIRLGFDARYPIPVTIAGNQGEVSGYFIRRQWIDALIAEEGLDPFEIQYTNEIGFTFGTDPKIKLWLFRLPRIGLGYRFGPTVSGWRLSFNFPF